jgi:adenylate kinase
VTRVVLVGPPGAGKGTQAAALSKQLGVPHISTGDLFRAHIAQETPLGLDVKRYLDEGKLVPDAVTNEMVRERLAESDAADGFLLDGFPRNVGQADVLNDMLAEADTRLDAVERLLARGRADDTEDVIRHRQHVYRDETAPLLAYYQDLLVTVDAVGKVDEITERVLSSLRARA